MNLLRHMTVEDLMSTAVISIKASESLSAASDAMHLADIHHLPVVDDHDRVLGVLSDRDLRQALAANGGRKHHIVADAMTRDVRTVRPETAAQRAAELMLDLKIGSLPVVGDDGHLIGVITATDFLSLAREALLEEKREEEAETEAPLFDERM